MSKSIAVLSGVLAFSLITCFVSTYLWIDRSISLDYMSQSYRAEKSSLENLQKILTLEWEGMSESALKKLEEVAEKMTGQEVIVKKEADTIWFDQVAFNFRNGRLYSVSSHSRP